MGAFEFVRAYASELPTLVTAALGPILTQQYAPLMRAPAGRIGREKAA